MSKTAKHLCRNIRSLITSRRGKRFIKEHQAIGGHAIENFTQACTFLTKATLVNGIIGTCGEVCINAVNGRHHRNLGRNVHTELHHDLCKTNGAGDNRFTAAVGAREHVNGCIFIKCNVICNDLVLNFECYAGIVKSRCRESAFFDRSNFGQRENTTLVFERAQHIGALYQKFKFGHQVEQELCIFKNVGLHNLLPRTQRGAVNVVNSTVKRERERHFLIFALLFAKGNKVCNAGIAIVFEIEA